MSALRTEETEGTEGLEDLESFRERARSFIRTNLRQVTPEELRWSYARGDDELELAVIKRDREIQRMLFDAGLAGICFPREYGGQGLTPEHQKIMNEELVGYEYPTRLQVPNFSPCASAWSQHSSADFFKLITAEDAEVRRVTEETDEEFGGDNFDDCGRIGWRSNCCTRAKERTAARLRAGCGGQAEGGRYNGNDEV